MKRLASYCLEALASDDPSGTCADKVMDQIEGWLRSKGNLSDDRQSVTLGDGRIATIDRAILTSSQGRLAEIVVTEPRPDGWFRTAITFAESEGTVAISVDLSAATSALAPVYVDIRCPRLVRDLLSPPSPWRYQRTPLTSLPVGYEGEAGGDAFIAFAWDPARPVPIVAVSDEYGSVFHPGIAERIAGDLAGLAVVVRLDPQASWRVTRRKGKEWSCFSGAIRLFWPQLAEDVSPYRHPLWTPSRLLASMPDSEAAADRIRRELRRRVLGQSAFAVSDPPLFLTLRHGAREEELSALRAKAIVGADYKALADEFFETAVKSNKMIAERDVEIENLRAKIKGLQYALQSKRVEHPEVDPETETPPSTVEDAVLLAMDELKDDLVFGRAVTDGIGTLAQDAGPPEKILTYLRILRDFTRTRKQGALGTTAIKWLQDHGAVASAESNTVRKSPREQQARTWDYGNGEQRVFDIHLKPSDATSPDRCVRIYFDYDDARRKTVVGWVGRHP